MGAVIHRPAAIQRSGGRPGLRPLPWLLLAAALVAGVGLGLSPVPESRAAMCSSADGSVQCAGPCCEIYLDWCEAGPCRV